MHRQAIDKNYSGRKCIVLAERLVYHKGKLERS